MILSAIAEKLKCRAKGDFKGRHFEATLILQAVSWYIAAVVGFEGPCRYGEVVKATRASRLARRRS